MTKLTGERGWSMTGEILGYYWDANGVFCMTVLTADNKLWDGVPVVGTMAEVV